MKHFLLLFLTCVCAVVCAQAQTDAASDSIIYHNCDVKPEFPGGNAAMMRYIGEHLQYPEAALKSGKQGKCVLRFVITKDGNVGEVKVLRSVSPECDAEAARVVRMLKFSPGKQNGVLVNVWYTLPITFRAPQPDPMEEYNRPDPTDPRNIDPGFVR